jgi:hypothetical protein
MGNPGKGNSPQRDGRSNTMPAKSSLPAGVKSFEFEKIDEITVLKSGGGSNHTATVISHEGSLLESEIVQAMTYCQRSAATARKAVQIAAIRSKFPMIAKYCDDDQIQAIACSEAGTKNARKEAVNILSGRLQINPITVARYFRKPTANK